MGSWWWESQKSIQIAFRCPDRGQAKVIDPISIVFMSLCTSFNVSPGQTPSNILGKEYIWIVCAVGTCCKLKQSKIISLHFQIPQSLSNKYSSVHCIYSALPQVVFKMWWMFTVFLFIIWTVFIAILIFLYP